MGQAGLGTLASTPSFVDWQTPRLGWRDVEDRTSPAFSYSRAGSLPTSRIERAIHVAQRLQTRESGCAA